MKKLLSGNAAIARGAYEYGVKVGTGYPGTPGTEILEEFSKYEGVYAEWAPNEKVALEVGIGASLIGTRAMVAMKHVGLNVAADPFMTFAYTGVNGGLVIVSADDPGMHSSQNEQDNRFYAKFSKIPMLEPSDSQECKEMIGLALQISEFFDIPVLLRITTRIAHSQGFVELKEVCERTLKPYKRDIQKWLMVPANGRLRRQSLEERVENLKRYTESVPVNFISWKDKEIGVITSGISYQYVQEVVPFASMLKLGMTYPLPVNLIKSFAGGVKKLFVVEELEPYIEESVRTLGIDVEGKRFFPAINELNPSLVREGFVKAGILPEISSFIKLIKEEIPQLPGRPPVLCPGCPHRGVTYVLNKLKLLATGDIGCYTLGGLPPLSGMDTCICMGASIGMAHGCELGAKEMHGRTIAVIGDSTFFHSGITGLLNVIYNNGCTTVIILDNGTTAMTGHQDHPATGKTLMGKPAPTVDLEALVRALGVHRVSVVDPLNLSELTRVIKEEIAVLEPSVIIARKECVFLSKEKKPPVTVKKEACNGCKMCIRLGCPAISIKDKVVSIDPLTCAGCGLCVQVCRSKALVFEEEVVTGA